MAEPSPKESETVRKGTRSIPCKASGSSRPEPPVDDPADPMCPDCGGMNATTGHGDGPGLWVVSASVSKSAPESTVNSHMSGYRVAASEDEARGSFFSAVMAEKPGFLRQRDPLPAGAPGSNADGDAGPGRAAGPARGRGGRTRAPACRPDPAQGLRLGDHTNGPDGRGARDRACGARRQRRKATLVTMEPDRLEDFRATFEAGALGTAWFPVVISRAQGEWALGEIERLRAENAALGGDRAGPRGRAPVAEGKGAADAMKAAFHAVRLREARPSRPVGEWEDRAWEAALAAATGSAR